MTTPPTAAAFEIGKGERLVPFLSEAEVERHLDPEQLLDGLQDGFAALERHEIQAPARPEIVVPDAGFSLSMMAWRPGQQICVKVVNVYEQNLQRAMPSHLAMIMLFDPDTGAVTCVMDGTHITAVRTAASAVLSARLLSRADATTATIIGAGVQAREHLRLLPLVRDLQRVHVYALDDDHAARLAATSPIARACTDLPAALADSDIVCLATHASAPVVHPDWIRAGAHVSSVGYHPPGGELPQALARRGRLFVEHADAFEPTPTGCAELTGLSAADGTTLGAVVIDPARGRADGDEITVYKAMGIGMEDLVAANLAYTSAGTHRAPAQTVRW